MKRWTKHALRAALPALLLGVAALTGCGGGGSGSSGGTSNQGKIVFESTRDSAPQGYNPEIYIMNADGSGQTRLTNTNALSLDRSPSLSADRRRIAFDSTREPSGIYIMNADGSQVKRVVNGGFPALNPDGSKVAFVRDYSTSGIEQFSIGVVNADGSGEKRLTTGSQDFDPAWSRDGRRLVFRRLSAIFVMNADGSGQKQIVAADNFNNTAPAFSPDGRRVAFLRNGDIFIVNADGSALTRVTQIGGISSHIAFSPDGKRLTFSRNDNVFTIKNDGSDQKQLTVNTGSNVNPDWR